MTIGLLGKHTSSSAGTYQLYQVPTGKKAEVEVTVVNQDTVTKQVILFISQLSSPLTKDTIHFENLTGVTNGFQRTALVLKAGDRVFYTTTASNTAVSVKGIVTDDDSEVVSDSANIISSNTITDVFTSTSGSCVTLTSSLTTGSNSDTGYLEVYVTPSTPVNGVLIYKGTLTSTNSGFELPAVALTSGDKIVIVSTGVSGNIATHIHGFRGVA